MARKVTLHGVRLWACDDDGSDEYALAPEGHCDARGRLRFGSALLGASYAHVFGDIIKRYGKVVAASSELIPGWPAHKADCASQAFAGGQGLEYIPCDCGVVPPSPKTTQNQNSE